MIDFKESYIRSGKLSEAMETIRVPLQYLYGSLNMDQGLYVGAIGIPYIDHNFWGRPSQQGDIERPPAIYNLSMAAADLYGASSAALSTGYEIFKDSDPFFAENLKAAAIYLYEWGSRTGGKYSNYHTYVTASTYPSNSFEDDLSWAAGWLYRITGDANYLTEALVHWSKVFPNVYSRWDSFFGQHAAHMVSLSDRGVEVPGIGFYREFLDSKYFRAWLQADGFQSVIKTPLNMVYPAWSMWGNEAYSTTAAAVAAIVAKYTPDQEKKSVLLNFARSQTDYAIGSKTRSYVVGYGFYPADQPHHAAASCPDMPLPCGWNDFSNPNPNPQIIYGALVAGPGGVLVNPQDPDNSFVNIRSDYVTNEVSVDYNAGFTTVLAGLYELL